MQVIKRLLRMRGRDPYRRGLALHESGNLAAAVAQWREAASAGHVEAQVRLGLALEKGEGVLGNPVDAVFWYRKAAERGHAEAQARLAVMYVRGCAPPAHGLSPETV